MVPMTLCEGGRLLLCLVSVLVPELVLFFKTWTICSFFVGLTLINRPVWTSLFVEVYFFDSLCSRFFILSQAPARDFPFAFTHLNP